MTTNIVHPRIVAIIQARMSSTRLPGKILCDIAGQPMLARVFERTKKANLLSEVIIATTIDPSDDVVQALCSERGYPFYRGSLFDVLDRYYKAACAYHADVIVRITGDCPLIDPSVIDTTVAAFLRTNNERNASTSTELSWDFVANRLPPPWHRTYPIGLDTEVCSFHALERAWKEAKETYEREHVMPYLYSPARAIIYSSRLNEISIPKINSGFFRVLVLDHETDYGSIRLTVDAAEDLELVRQIYQNFPDRDDFSWLEVIELLHRKPELLEVNANVQHKSTKDIDRRGVDQIKQ